MNKTDTHAFVNQLLIYTLVMVCFSGSIGLGTVWLRQQMAQTANSIKQIETRTSEIDRRLAETNALVSAEQSPDILAHRNIAWQLGLVAPKQDQVRRVEERPEERLAAKRNSELFAETATLSPVRFVMQERQR